ncbi:MAG: hypothetical protein NVSMB4_13830 [Acidimicrobiales bacterium]
MRRQVARIGPPGELPSGSSALGLGRRHRLCPETAEAPRIATCPPQEDYEHGYDEEPCDGGGDQEDPDAVVSC